MNKESENLQEPLTIAFKFPLPHCLTLNSQISLARSHKFTSAKFKEEWTSYMAELAISQIPKEITGNPIFPGKVWITYLWIINSHANDEDNISASRKYILDGLKKAKIITDDNLSIIQEPVIHYWRLTKRISTHKPGAHKKKLFLPKDLEEYPTNQQANIIISSSMKFGFELFMKKYSCL